MIKKPIVLLFVMCIFSVFMFSGCSSYQIEILFLGDSIAEGLAGISPISERERYAYYGVLGIRNEYIYRNRAVGGHRTSNMLELIQREDTDIRMIQSHIKNADIIHVSIIGNDLLQNNLGKLMYEWAQGDTTMVESILESAERNFAEIVDFIKENNPKATVFFQNVYNPVLGKTRLISDTYRQQLSALDIQESEYRELGAEILGELNNIISRYLADNPESFYLIDAYGEFDRIYQEDILRGQRLISRDAVHPSTEGHAVLADLTQQKLEELNLASPKKALKNYKTLRKQQLKELYKDSVNIRKVNSLINKATTCSQVTERYFEAILDKQPNY